MEIMDRSSVRKMTLILTVLVLVPVICSCSLFKKKAVIKAATEFGDALRIGDASDILEKTDGLGLEFKKSFKAQPEASAATRHSATISRNLFLISTPPLSLDSCFFDAPCSRMVP